MERKEDLERKLRVASVNLSIIEEKKDFECNQLFWLKGFTQEGFRHYEEEIPLPDDIEFIKAFIQRVKDYYKAEIHNIKLELEVLDYVATQHLRQPRTRR